MTSTSTIGEQHPGNQGGGTSSEEVLVFLCYRQLDGVRVAEWLFELLDGHTLGASNAKRLKVYFDRTAQVVGDWRTLHEPSLKTARSLLFVSSPGALARHEGEDWVHLELDWWLKNRKTPPIVVDPTRTDGKWVPRSIRKRWPNVQRVNLDLDGMATLLPEQKRRYVDNITVQICQSILFGSDSVAFDEFIRQRRLARSAFVLSFLLAVVAGLSIWFATSARIASHRADEARRLALEQSQTAIRTIGTMTSYSSKLKDKTEARDLLAEGVEGYNKVLAMPIVDDPDFQFERAWVLNRLAEALRESSALGLNLLGKRWDGYVTDPDSAVESAIDILEAQLKRSEEWRFRLELGDSWLAAAENSIAVNQYNDAINRARSAVAQFELLNKICEDYLCKRQLFYANARLAHALEMGLKPREEVLAAYAAALQAADGAILQARKDFGSMSSEELDARDHRFEVARRHLDFLGKATSMPQRLVDDHLKDGLELAFDIRTHNAVAALHVVTHVLESCESCEPLLRSKVANLKGDIETRLDQHAAAFESFFMAARTLDGVADRSSDEDSQLAAVLNNLADAHRSAPEASTHEFGSEQKMAERALELQQRAIAANPQNLQFREFRRNHRIVLGRVLVRNGRTTDARLQVRALLNEIWDDAALARSTTTLSRPHDDEVAQQYTHLRSTCFNGAALSQSIGDKDLECKLLECFLEFRPDRMWPDVVGVTAAPQDMHLLASILISHARIVAQSDPEAAYAECSEARQILERLAKEHPYAPDFAEAAKGARTQCDLLQARVPSATDHGRMDREAPHKGR